MKQNTTQKTMTATTVHFHFVSTKPWRLLSTHLISTKFFWCKSLINRKEKKKIVRKEEEDYIKEEREEVVIIIQPLQTLVKVKKKKQIFQFDKIVHQEFNDKLIHLIHQLTLLTFVHMGWHLTSSNIMCMLMLRLTVMD